MSKGVGFGRCTRRRHPLKRAVRRVFDDARQSTSATKRLLNPPTDNSFAGSRAYPAKGKKKDEAFGVRFDCGMVVKGQPNLVTMDLQVNADAKESALRSLARKYGSHRKYVSLQVDTTQEVNETNPNNLNNKVDEEIDALNDL